MRFISLANTADADVINLKLFILQQVKLSV